MSIWQHHELYRDLNKLCNLDFYNTCFKPCFFCGAKLNSRALDVTEFTHAPDLISMFKTDLLDVTRRKFPEYFTDLPDSYFEILDKESSDLYSYCYACEFCGWWIADYRGFLAAKDMIWEVIAGVSAVLKEFDISDISTPIQDIRSFLSGRYKTRNILHPIKYEEVVASVFSDLGYDVKLTSYNHDDGIDILLENDSDCIGVQVKRTKNKIQIDTIRSFVGALILGGFTKGIFVTTSDFTKVSRATADIANKSIIPIELWDASSFLEVLKVAQVSCFDFDSILNSVLKTEFWTPIAFCNLNSL
ncbi:restriction endonuclease [Aliifodinibius salicampi]|uniref:Restriction endonuclease n=1 Tax=Fodinibius salicampi TaxID=1920655 RepID=A0ABT3PZD9_9BACT|nr:restriction endonuclease [Fodinibius salicampi]MCW9713196.1 restriction endonuclease [Fodinibius salicampi]